MRLAAVALVTLAASIPGCRKGEAPPAVPPPAAPAAPKDEAKPAPPEPESAAIRAEPAKEAAPTAPTASAAQAPKPAEPAATAVPLPAAAPPCEAALDHIMSLARTEQTDLAKMLREGLEKEPRDKMLARCRDDEVKHPGAAQCIVSAPTLEAVAQCDKSAQGKQDAIRAAVLDDKATREICEKAVENLLTLAKKDSTELGKAIMKQLDEKKRDFFVLECIKEEPKRPGSARCVAGVTTLQGLSQCATAERAGEPEAAPPPPMPAPTPAPAP